MLYKAFVVAAGLVASTAADLGCLTPPPSDGVMSKIGSAPAALSARAPTYIDTYIHVVSQSTSASDGYLSVSQHVR